MPQYFYLDFETRSKLELRKVGADVYSRHPSTKVTSTSYAFDDDPVIHIPGPPDPCLFFGCIWVAHNHEFEQAIIRNTLGYEKPIEWEDTMALAAAMSLPLSLEKLAAFFGYEKDMAGHRVMLKLSKPRRPSKENKDEFWERETKPEDFDILDDYNQKDCGVMRQIHKRLLKLSQTEKSIFNLTRKINEHGIAVDVASVLRAAELVRAETKRISAEFESIAGCNPRNPTAVARLLGLPDSRKLTIERELSKTRDPLRRHLLEMRQLLGRSSVAKLEGLLLRTGPGKKLRGSLVYGGAQRTLRWASRGVQLQNIPRGYGASTDSLFSLLEMQNLDVYDEPLRVIPGMLRGFFGGPFLVGDFAQIEARVTAWLAGQSDLLDAFANNKDPYRKMAAQIYGKPEKAITKDERFVGKTIVLGCGYQMGPDRLQSTLTGYKVDVDWDFCMRCIRIYRATNPRIKNFWWDIQRCWERALDGHPNKHPSGITFCRAVHFGVRYMVVGLPSGRKLYYAKPERDLSGELRYFGQNIYTRQWEQVKTYGGKMVENIVQATARDILARAMLRLDSAGFDVVLTVHDEVVAEDDGRLKTFESIMKHPPDWAPGLPVEVEVFSCARYRK